LSRNFLLSLEIGARQVLPGVSDRIDSFSHFLEVASSKTMNYL